MQHSKHVGILFIAGFGPIVPDRSTSKALYGEVLDIPFKEENDGFLILSP